MRVASSAVLGGLGLAVLAVLAAGLFGPAPAPAADTATTPPRVELVVATHLPVPGLRAGAVRGDRIVAATGLEADVARALARRLGLELRLVDVADRVPLTRARTAAWDVAIGGITPDATGGAERSVPYLVSDPVVLLRPGLRRPRTLADLRERVLCAVGGAPGGTVARRIRSAFPILWAPSDAALAELTASGRCDAAIGDAPGLGVAVQRAGGRRGHVGGRIDTGARWVIAVPRDDQLLADVDRALRRLRADGTLARIAERWLGFDPAALRALR